MQWYSTITSVIHVLQDYKHVTLSNSTLPLHKSFMYYNITKMLHVQQRHRSSELKLVTGRQVTKDKPNS